MVKIVENHIKLYSEPELDEEGNLIKEPLSEEEKNRKLQMNLLNDVLITNCGVPIIIVINKTDNSMPKYEEKTEFILRHIRKNAINYGAAVIYTSTKSNYNINVLYDYILHILLNFDLIHKSNVIDKNSFFIPSGYDRLSVLKSNDLKHDLDFDYSEVIVEEKEDTKEEEEIKSEKLSDYLKKVKDRVIRSRKSVFQNTLSKNEKGNKMRKSIQIEIAKEKSEKEKAMGTGEQKVNKFQKFMDKRSSKLVSGDINALDKDEQLSKEEKAKKSRENLLNKLKLGKKK